MAFALICALGAGVLTFYALERQATVVQSAVAPTPPPTPTPRPTIKVPVAASNLAVGTVLSDTLYVLKDIPAELVPGNVISRSAELDNRILVEEVAEGDFFRQNDVLGGEGASISRLIDQGKTVLAFPIIDLLSQVDVIRDGDYVDLLLTLDLKGPDGEDLGRITGYTVQRAEVLQVLRPAKTEDNPNPRPTALLLVVSPEDAVMVKFVKDRGGVIDLALRSPLDEEPFDVPPATDNDLAIEFDFIQAGGR